MSNLFFTPSKIINSETYGFVDNLHLTTAIGTVFSVSICNHNHFYFIRDLKSSYDETKIAEKFIKVLSDAFIYNEKLICLELIFNLILLNVEVEYKKYKFLLIRV